MSLEKQVERMGERIGLLRNLAVLLNVFVVVTVGAIMFIPGLLAQEIMVYLISVCGFLFLMVTVALIMARKDSTATLYFTGLSLLLAGLIAGVFIGAVVASVAKRITH
jgi:hypothetical protein